MSVQLSEREMRDMLTCLHSSCNKLKNKLRDLLAKVEIYGDKCDWPKYLTTFSLCAAELSEIRKLLDTPRFEKALSLIVTPIMLNPDKDPSLAKITEERLLFINHDSVPVYLRTKLDPSVEQQYVLHEKKIPPTNNQEQLMKLVNQSNKLLDNGLKEVHHLKQEIEADFSSSDHQAARPTPNKASRNTSSSQGPDDALDHWVDMLMNGKGLCRQK